MVTRVFDSRAQAFIKHSLMRSGYSGLKVKNYCYRIEFQARGMPHIHGVLWLEKESIKDYLLNPILGGLWNYVTGRGGAIMARMDSSHPEAVSVHPKAQK